MLTNLPIYIVIIFVLTTAVTLALFIQTVRRSDAGATREKSGMILIGLTGWLVFQAVLTLNNVYSADTLSFPPKIMLAGIFPAVLTIILLFATSKGRRFADSLPLQHLMYLNTVRIPVEIVLFWLFLNHAVPQLMTFEGRNFDILAGITAPAVAYFGFTKRKISRAIILIWHLVCLALLANIVVHALLSAPSPIQKLAFDQPNIAILHFPFSWLPTFIVPIVLFGHLASIRQLMQKSYK